MEEIDQALRVWTLGFEQHRQLQANEAGQRAENYQGGAVAFNSTALLRAGFPFWLPFELSPSRSLETRDHLADRFRCLADPRYWYAALDYAGRRAGDTCAFDAGQTRVDLCVTARVVGMAHTAFSWGPNSPPHFPTFHLLPPTEYNRSDIVKPPSVYSRRFSSAFLCFHSSVQSSSVCGSCSRWPITLAMIAPVEQPTAILRRKTCSFLIASNAGETPSPSPIDPSLSEPNLQPPTI